jgi:hypothetical protein
MYTSFFLSLFSFLVEKKLVSSLPRFSARELDSCGMGSNLVQSGGPTVHESAGPAQDGFNFFLNVSNALCPPKFSKEKN